VTNSGRMSLESLAVPLLFKPSHSCFRLCNSDVFAAHKRGFVKRHIASPFSLRKLCHARFAKSSTQRAGSTGLICGHVLLGRALLSPSHVSGLISQAL
jgi:hypothetical protein